MMEEPVEIDVTDLLRRYQTRQQVKTRATMSDEPVVRVTLQDMVG